MNQLSFFAQFTTDLQNVSGKHNVVADVLSRVETISVEPVSADVIAKAQDEDPELPRLLAGGTSLRLERVPVPGTSLSL